MYEPIKSDVNDFLDKTKKEREIRRLESSKTKSAVIIQKWYRGYRCRSRIYEYTRSEYILLINENEAVQIHHLIRGIRCLKFRFDMIVDKKNFELLVRQMLLSLDSSKSSNSFVSSVLKKDTIAEFIRISNWLLKTSVEYLGKLDPALQNDSRFMNILLTFCLNMLSCQRWKLVVSMKNPNLINQLSKITDSLFGRLLKQNLLGLLRELLLKGICKQSVTLTQTSLNGIMSLILKVFTKAPSTTNVASGAASVKPDVKSPLLQQHNSISDANMLAFINSILSVPALIKHMNIMVNDIFQSIVRDRICTDIVLFLHKNPTNQEEAFRNLQASYSLCIIANIIDLGLLEMDVLANHGSEFCTVLSSLLVRLNKSIGQTQSSSTNHYHHIFGWSGVYMDENIQSSIVYLRSQLKLLWSSKMIRSMFDELYDQPILSQSRMSTGKQNQQAPNSNTKQPNNQGSNSPTTKHNKKSSNVIPLFKLPRLPTNITFWKKFQQNLMLQQQHFLHPNSTTGTANGSSNLIGGTTTAATSVCVQSIMQMPISIQSVCMLYFYTTSCLSQIRDDILAGVSLTDLPARMWRLIKSSGSVKQWASLLQQRDAGWYAQPHPTHLLHIFVLIAINLFIILDDVEVFDKEKVFTVAEVLEIADFFNKLFVEVVFLTGNDSDVLNSLMNTKVQSSVATTKQSTATTGTAVDNICRRSTIDLSSLYHSCHRLLMILHERDVRHPFTVNAATAATTGPSASDTFWLIKSIKPSQFISDLNKDKFIPKFLLTYVPHIIPHKDRVVYFRERIKAERNQLGLNSRSWNHDDSPIGAVISVRRNRMVEDGYEQLMKINIENWKKKIRVRFINELGMDEVGIDLDGVFKEFLEETIRSLLNPSLGLFCLTSEQRLYPSPLSGLYEPNHLLLFQYLGRMMAKALYEGLLIEAPFAHFFLTQILKKEQTGLYSFLDELATFDKDLYRSLTYVKHYEGDVSDLELTFSYDEDRMGCIETHDLRPGGRYMTVTNDNRISYVHMVARFRMFVQIRYQVRAFINGFYGLVQRDWLDIFSVPELLKLICGDTNKIDIDDLKSNVKYSGGFHSNHKVINWLWDVLKNEFTEQEKGLFLKFVTSCSKPPLLGFSYLNPPFSVRCVHNSDEDDSPPPPSPQSVHAASNQNEANTGSTNTPVALLHRLFHHSSSSNHTKTVHTSVHRLPSAATCFNLLKLPNYPTKSILKDKLRYVIHAGAGFELS